MTKLRLALVVAAFIAGCGSVYVSPPASDTWRSTIHGVDITWRRVQPGSLGEDVLGNALYMRPAPLCTVNLAVEAGWTFELGTAAHELGHCLDGKYGITAGQQGDGTYWNDPREIYARAYAEAYLRTCGDVLPWALTDQACIPNPREVNYGN